MRSRLAIGLMLVFGFALSGSGATLAVSGTGGDDPVSQSGQYGSEQESPTLVPTPAPDQGGVAGEEDVSDENESGAGAGGGGENGAGNAPAGSAPDVAGVDAVQETRQFAAQGGGDELPFTGFAAIPVILVGVFLLLAGIVLARRSGQEMA